LIVTLLIGYSCAVVGAEDGGSTIMSKEEVDATLKQGLANLATGRTVSDIVMRHIDVGEENMGVSVVQRSKVEASGVETGIAHVDLDEIYYIVAGEGPMVTGGEFVEKQTSLSSLAWADGARRDSRLCAAEGEARLYRNNPLGHATRLARDDDRHDQLHHLPRRRLQGDG